MANSDYTVAQATVTIPGSVQRLSKLGYANTILMSDIWPFTHTTADNADTALTGYTDQQLVPVVYVVSIQAIIKS